MNKKEQEDDWLKPLFGLLPEEELPASFREEMMKRIQAETAWIRKRNELTGLLMVILASLAMMGLAAGALLYTNIPHPGWRIPELVTLPFYSYIGALTLLLLGIDHLLRRTYRKKHPD
jgi:hypothetical protein